MSAITMHKCETCGKSVEDKYNVPGWIEMDLRKISQQAGRDKSGVAKSLFYEAYTCERENLMDFCSEGCALGFFRKTLKSVPAQKSKKP